MIRRHAAALLVFLASQGAAQGPALDSLRSAAEKASPGSTQEITTVQPLRPLQVESPSAPDTLKTFRGVIHCHSKLSFDSTGTFEDIAGAARRAGVDFVIMTDHPGPGVPEAQPRGFLGPVLFIPGIETLHLLAINVTRPLREGAASDVARQVAAQGGMTFVAHPELFKEWDAQGLAGTEIYNMHADLSDEYLPWAVTKALWSAGKDPLQALTALLDFPGPAVSHWDAQSRSRPFVGIAANDAHQNIKVLGKQLDPYDVPFRFMNTCVLAPRLDAASVLEALRLGHAYVAFRAFGETDGFSFRADDGETAALMGETLSARGPVSLTAAAPQSCEFRLFKDGVEIRREAHAQGPAAFRAPAEGPGLYRLEVFRRAGGRMRPWILANPIRITDAAAPREPR